MKRFNFLSAVIAIVLVVTVASCTTMQGGGYEDDYYTDSRRSPNRIYVDDPYYGTIVLERDPYSGRYYQVGPYNSYSRYDDPYYRNNNYRNRVYRNNQRVIVPSTPQQTETQRKRNRKEEG